MRRREIAVRFFALWACAVVSLTAARGRAQDAAAPRLNAYGTVMGAAGLRVADDVQAYGAARATVGIVIDEHLRIGALAELLIMHTSMSADLPAPPGFASSSTQSDDWHNSPLGGAEIAWRFPLGDARSPLFDLGAHVMLGELQRSVLVPALGFRDAGSLLVIAGVHGTFALPIGRHDEVALRLEAQAWIDASTGLAASGHAGLQWGWR